MSEKDFLLYCWQQEIYRKSYRLQTPPVPSHQVMDYATRYKALHKGIKEIRRELLELRNSLLPEDESLPVEAQPIGEIEEQNHIEDQDEGEDFFAHLTREDQHMGEEELLRAAINVVIELGYASTLVLQQRLGITYRRAMDLIDRLEHDGLIGPAHGFRPHKALSAAYSFQEHAN